MSDHCYIYSVGFCADLMVKCNILFLQGVFELLIGGQLLLLYGKGVDGSGNKRCDLCVDL